MADRAEKSRRDRREPHPLAVLAGEFAEINGDQYVAACQGMDEETLFASDAFAQLKDALVAYALPKNIAALKRDLGKYRIDYDVWFHESTLHESGAVLSVCLLAGCGASASSTASSAASSVAASEVASSAASKAQATVEFAVTAADGSVSSVLLNVTDGEKLSTALAEAGIISQEEADAGFVTTVNGETADYDKDQAWWCLTDAAGEMTTVGVADIELHDGDSYAFTYTKG